MRKIFQGLKVLNRNEWLHNQAVITENQKIAAIVPSEMALHHLPAKIYTFSDTHSLVPGFIDMHIHGANGADVMDATPQALSTISKALAKEGVTYFLATTMTADQVKLESVLQNIGQKSPLSGAKCGGVHLEGPFISRQMLGAQPDETLAPNLDQFKRWQRLTDNQIKVVTVAPELPHAFDLIADLHKSGVIVSVGHTLANYEQTQRAISAGCSHATHWFNAMGVMKQRAPGAITSLLLSPHVYTELIVDGVHVHPAIVELAFRIKHKERIILVTDAIRAKCLGEGTYDLGGQMVTVQNNIAYLSPDRLAGSTLTMPQAIKNIMDYTQCSLADAIQMASLNPAEQLGWLNKGCIDVGKDADFVILDDNLEVSMTVCEGEVIFSGTRSS